VCRKWKSIANSPSLWRSISFRPTHGGLQVTNHDYLVHLIGVRFTEMNSCELPTELITPNILHELANKCPKLNSLTLDFSTAMQLSQDFGDLQAFPRFAFLVVFYFNFVVFSRLQTLTICLSENIFLEGFLRKVYTFISSVEFLHVFGEFLDCIC
jgi:hypothetical protein